MTGDPRDYKLEINSLASENASDSPAAARPYLSVHFACCSAYQRIYRDRDGAAYSGRCPRCGKPVRFAVGSGGTPSRFFRVS